MQIKAVANVPTTVSKSGSLAETVNVDIPATLEGMSKKFGVDVTTDIAKKAFVIAYQAFMRGKMVKKEVNEKTKKAEIVGVGLKGAALQASVDGYKPSLRKAGKSFLDKVRDKAKSMSDEEKRALLAELQGGGGSGGSTPTRKAAPTARPAARPSPRRASAEA